MECIEGMRQLEDNSVDSIVTDPPYELGFMGRGWDRTGIAYNVEMWEECLRVLKPGGYLRKQYIPGFWDFDRGNLS